MNETERAPQRRLSKRDLWLLPLVMGATLVAMGAGAEVSARIIWPEKADFPCLRDDDMGGALAKPNCRSRVKAAEGPWVVNEFNECGLRATGPCEATDRGPRIVVVGSSTSWGYMVPFEQVWSTRLANALSERCGGAAFDVQSFPTFATINGTARHIDDALALDPDLVAYVIAPLDLEQINERGFIPPEEQETVQKAEDDPETLLGWARNLVSESRVGKMMQHYLYRNPDIYIPAFLTNGDKADFLRAPLSPEWTRRINAVSEALHYYQRRLQATDTPLMLIYTPQQAQAVLISEDGEPREDVDPTELPDRLAEVAARVGAIYADVSDEFEDIRRAEDMFYNADGHMNGRGHALIAEAAEDALTQALGAAPLCRRPTQQQASR